MKGKKNLLKRIGDKRLVTSIAKNNLVFSDSYGEVIFIDAENTAYVATEGVIKKVFDSTSEIQPVLPPLTARITRISGQVVMHVFSISTFKKDLMSCTNSDGSHELIYLNKDSEWETVFSGVGLYQISSDGKIIAYTDMNGILYKTKVKQPKKAKKMAEDADNFIMTYSGKEIYCVGRDGTLRFIKNGGGKHDIAENVTRLQMASDHTVFFIDNNSKLYSSYNGGGKNAVNRGENADYLVSTASVTYYLALNADNGTDLYISTGGTGFSKILSNVDVK